MFCFLGNNFILRFTETNLDTGNVDVKKVGILASIIIFLFLTNAFPFIFSTKDLLGKMLQNISEVGKKRGWWV